MHQLVKAFLWSLALIASILAGRYLLKPHPQTISYYINGAHIADSVIDR